MSIKDFAAYTHTATLHYLECASWASGPITDSEGTEHESGDGFEFAGEAFEAARADVSDFCMSQQSLIDALGLPAVQVGHDFFLNRNRHGAGFWDRDNGAMGDALSDAAKVYGSADVYLGDDGYLYLG